MAPKLFVGHWPLVQFRNPFTQTVGLLGRVIGPSQGRCLHTGQHKHRVNAHKDVDVLTVIRTHDPSVRASKTLDRTPTVIGDTNQFTKKNSFKKQSFNNEHTRMASTCFPGTKEHFLTRFP
jgi:hypothetical protein